MFQSLTGRISLAMVLLLSACDGTTTVPEPPAAVVAAGTYAEATRDNVVVYRELGSDVGVSTLFTGEWLLTLSVPSEQDGKTWIHVEYGDGIFGWLAIDPDDPPFEPVEPDCPEVPAGAALEVAEVVEMSVAERLICFGGETITLTPVTWRELTSDIPYGGEPEWLADETPLQLYGRGGWDHEVPLPARIDPAVDIRMVPDSWGAITGSFDHPDSAGCTRDIDTEGLGILNEEQVIADLAPMTRQDGVLWCRQQFVITDVSPIAAPAPVAEPRAPPAGGSWRAIPEAPLAGRTENGAVWTGSEMIVWGGRATKGPEGGHELFMAADGAAYDPEANSWRSLAPAPIGARGLPIMVWTGAEVLVMGGHDETFDILTDGAAYAPASDSWRPVAPLPDAVAVGGSAAVWTGRELVVVAGDGTGAAAYDPAGDDWRDLPDPELPNDLWSIGLVWTDDQAILMGHPNAGHSVGLAYDPATDAWRELPESPVRGLDGWPPVWIGGEMLVLSRSSSSGDPDGVPPDTTYAGLYDPSADSWRIAGIQSVFLGAGNAVWTGRLLISDSAAYDPASDAWSALPARPHEHRPNPVWTGEEVLFWGGSPGGDLLDRFNDGLAYRPER